MASVSPSTINARLSAVRKMVGEARRAGMIRQEETVSLTDITDSIDESSFLHRFLLDCEKYCEGNFSIKMLFDFCELVGAK